MGGHLRQLLDYVVILTMLSLEPQVLALAFVVFLVAIAIVLAARAITRMPQTSVEPRPPTSRRVVGIAASWIAHAPSVPGRARAPSVGLETARA